MVKIVDFSELCGKTFNKIEHYEEALVFYDNDSQKIYYLHHEQDCCEGIWIEDICGDLQSLINNIILVASEESNKKVPESENHSEYNEYYDSYTWTFYILETMDASITIRFYGASNGYYSERADLYVCRSNTNGIDISDFGDLIKVYE